MKIIRGILVLLFLCGLGVFLYPDIQKGIGTYKQRQEIQSFEKKEDLAHTELFHQIQQYNATLYQKKQEGLVDAFSFETHDVDVSELGFEEDLFGYIKIEKMNVEIPLYLGSTMENMEKGVAVLGETSLPIGGQNTNCVIAGHRGRLHANMFLDIERLEVKDRIQIINPWETLEYEVLKWAVIDPMDVEAVKIQEGADLVTLMTCHPFPESYQRYVVYCQRVNSQEPVDLKIEEQEFVSSQKDIEKEAWLHKMGLVICALILLIGLVLKIKRK